MIRRAWRKVRSAAWFAVDATVEFLGTLLWWWEP